jgi:hypothetical protein
MCQKGRKQDNKELIQSAERGRKERMVSKHGMYFQCPTTNNKRRKATVSI